MQSKTQTRNQEGIILLIPHQNMSYQSFYWQHSVTLFMCIQLHLYKYLDCNRMLGIFVVYHVVCFCKEEILKSIEAIKCEGLETL